MFILDVSFFRGAEAVVYAALLPPDTGVRENIIWHDKTFVEWLNEPYPALM